MTLYKIPQILLISSFICFCLALPPIGCSSNRPEPPPILYKWNIELTNSQGIQKVYTTNSCFKPYILVHEEVIGVWTNTRYSSPDWITDERFMTVPDGWIIVISLSEIERSE
jgi:hypothetical protein